MRTLFLLSSMLIAMPALATDEPDTDETSDTDGSDTDAADTDGETASERAGDEGGMKCDSAAVATAGLVVPAFIAGLALVARRREGNEA